MAKYYEKLGETAPDNLIANLDVKQITQSVTVKSGQGKLARGTVLAMSGGTAGTGKCVIAGTSAGSNEVLTAFGILCDDVDATSEDAVAEVYVAGAFNKGALIVKESTTLTAAQIQELRNGGIYLESVMA